MEKVICSIHIPKTGGTSMGEMLKERYGDKMMYVYATYEAGKFAIAPGVDSIMHQIFNGYRFSIHEVMHIVHTCGIRCIHGNLSTDDFINYFDRLSFVIFIREPIERAHSEFEYMARNGFSSDYDTYIVQSQNTMSRQIVDPQRFEFIGQFKNFSEDIKRLGLVEKHSNESNGKKYEVKTEFIKQYNENDIELYNRLTK